MKSLWVLCTFWFVSVLLADRAYADYRAFRLEIFRPGTPEKRETVTTLDSIQYPQYYPLNLGESVRELDTWMCWGFSEPFQPICDSPRAPSSASSVPALTP